MKQNLGEIDSRVRSIVAWILVVIVVLKLISSYWAWMATFTAIILLFTAFMHNCPLYKLIGINTFLSRKMG